jgi:uncharacterized membrane protein YcjF (UPF0283 family)
MVKVQAGLGVVTTEWIRVVQLRFAPLGQQRSTELCHLFSPALKELCVIVVFPDF